jgi:hypothetical protein
MKRNNYNDLNNVINDFNKKMKIDNNDISNNDSSFNDISSNKLDNFINIFDNKLKINDISNNKCKSNDREYTNVYIHSCNVCDPKEYLKDTIYLNYTSILVNSDNTINLINNINISTDKIKHSNKIKIRNKYYKFIFLNNRYNFDKFNLKWYDIINFYTLYNKKTDNFIDIILKDDFNKQKLNRKLNIIELNKLKNKKNKIKYKLNIKYIFLNMNKNFNKIFKK